MAREMLTEREILYATTNSSSNSEAARFLRITKQTWKRYAQMYFESTTGKTYYEFLRAKHKSKFKPKKPSRLGTDIQAILDGLRPTYSKLKLEQRLLDEGLFDPRCESCGFSEQNILTKQIPLILDCIDGDDRNFNRVNLRYLCYNCANLVGGYNIKVTR